MLVTKKQAALYQAIKEQTIGIDFLKNQAKKKAANVVIVGLQRAIRIKKELIKELTASTNKQVSIRVRLLEGSLARANLEGEWNRAAYLQGTINKLKKELLS